MDKKIVIFGHARSGSNSLIEILNSNKNIRIVSEPFNWYFFKKFHSPSFPKSNFKDKESIDSYLNNLIYKDYNGIKTLTEHLPFELNKELLLNPNNKIIFLARKNILQTAISRIIAETIKTWYVDKNTIKKYKKRVSDLSIENIDIKKIGEKINNIKREVQIYKEVLDNNKIKYFNVYYEELFIPSVPEEDKFLKIKKIFEFLGYNQELNINAIKEVLEPKNRKMTDKKIYRKIPNIIKIEKEFGNNENGYLFENY